MKFMSTALLSLLSAIPASTYGMETSKLRGFDEYEEFGHRELHTRSGTCKPSIVVANRGSGTVSVIDAETAETRGTVTMPGNLKAEPVYVVALHGLVWVGDRRNKQVLAYDQRNFRLRAIMPVGAGIFHMFADQAATFLWVVCDIDKTIVVIDMKNFVTVKTIPIPAELAVHGQPHDIVVDFEGRYAYVTIIGIAPDNGRDAVIKYDFHTYEEVDRLQDIVEDPHVGLHWRSNNLFVGDQGGSKLRIVKQANMSDTVAEFDIPSAHGIFVPSPFDNTLYVTDIVGDGEFGIYVIDYDKNELVGSILSGGGVPRPPHNVAGTGDGKIFVTHSGPEVDIVSYYSVGYEGDARIPVFEGVVKLDGLNPMGLDYAESVCWPN